ncbi:transposase [Streptomyces sp. NPDC050600]|uniref:transposase n=1 Tax=Streptomyces sp. NPDC050600 TaxID=3157213 RepID=UPI00344090BB
MTPTENCQIGVFTAYATALSHALVDRGLYLPKSWTDDPECCRAVKIPSERGFATKNYLARTMVLRALASALPVAWVAADAAYGQDSRFRRFLEDAGLSYIMAVPKSQQVHGPRIDHEDVPLPVGQRHTGRDGRGVEEAPTVSSAEPIPIGPSTDPAGPVTVPGGEGQFSEGAGSSMSTACATR